MTLAEIDALRSLRFDQLRIRAAEVGVAEAKRAEAVTCDELRLAIIRKLILDEERNRRNREIQMQAGRGQGPKG